MDKKRCREKTTKRGKGRKKTAFEKKLGQNRERERAKREKGTDRDTA